MMFAGRGRPGAAHDHGILCTVREPRGVDAVPVAYVVDDDSYVGVPVDRVKPKASSRLQRERNLGGGSAGHPAGRALGPRRLVTAGGYGPSCDGRAHPRRPGGGPGRGARRAYPQYRDKPFDRVLVLRIVGISGWAGSAS